MPRNKERESATQLVVVGASAGGIDALSRLLSHLPDEFPAPIVIAQHLDPQRASHLQAILAGPSRLPVATVTQKTRLEPGTVYVVPSNQNVVITNHDVTLQPPGSSGPKPSIDMLLTSASRLFHENLIAIILTGTGSDGAAGAEEVKRAGGTVIIQDPSSAQYPALPLSLAPTVVDLSLTVEEMGPKLQTLFTDPSAHVTGTDSLAGVLKFVGERSAIDFNNYKRPTIMRRLQRRMVATDCNTVDEYLAYLNTDPDEVRALVDNFLIKVTEFFRDPETFDALRDRVLPDVISLARRNGGEIRIWSAGCATGEEAYSIAILLAELLGEEFTQFHVRIFATDLDAEAIEFARRGMFPTSSVEHVPDDLLSKHFTFTGTEYQIKKNIRTMMLFGQHDLGDRPPFPRIDLLVCRNVLIYFGVELQRHVLRLFAFSLREDGYLVLGKSETVSFLPSYFVADDNHLKIFRRRGDRPRVPAPHGTHDLRPTIQPPPSARPFHRAYGSPSERAESVRVSVVEGESRWLPTFQQLSSGVVFVDRKYNIQFINLAARKLFGVYGSAVGDDLVHLAQHVPPTELRNGLERVFRSGEEVVLDGLSYVEPPDPDTHFLRIVCRPYDTDGQGKPERYALITVEDVTTYKSASVQEEQSHKRLAEEHRQSIERLGALGDVVTDLRKANEDLTSENLDLRSANEEFLVGNEELQAGAEEVETLNEELQASNEELETLNEELQETVEEWDGHHGDLHARSIELEESGQSVEEARARSESERARLEAVLLGMADAVLLVNRKGEPLLWNQSFANRFEPDFDVVADIDGNQIVADQRPQARAARGDSFSMEFSLDRDQNGNRQYFEVVGHPVGLDGTFEGGVLVIRDITDRSLRRLQDEFMALASHELRTPLTVLRGYLTLLDRPGYEERRGDYLRLARERTSRIERLVHDLLDTARLQHRQLTLTFETVDVASVLKHALTSLQALDETRTIHFEPPERPVEVMGDPERLEQVFLNILHNADKYTPESSEIRVSLRTSRGKAIIAFKDSGPGIAEADIPNLFTRFFRSSTQSDNGVAGLGLGLYISKELVGAHGGDISVESVNGSGATFTIRLPLAPTGKERPTRSKQRVRSKGKTGVTAA